MCYAYKPVYGLDGTIFKVPFREFKELTQDGSIILKPDGYHYAKDTVGVLVHAKDGIKAMPMRWDLIPKDFLWNEKLTLAETIIKPAMPSRPMLVTATVTSTSIKVVPDWRSRHR